MVQVFGWAPSSHKTDPTASTLSQFISPFANVEEKDPDYPLIRSGHRCFTDNDFFYVIGGYTDTINEGSIFKELWAMNLITFEWRRYEAKGELPEHLASFSIVQTFPYSKSFILFGGSGTTFGSSSSNDFYMLRVNNDLCTVDCCKLDVKGAVPEPVYGHAMCAGEVPGKFYIIGGTQGVLFNINVHALTMKADNNEFDETQSQKVTWHCELISSNLMFPGRYRLEVTYDENNQCLVFFGGGNDQEVYGFESMITLNVNTRESVERRTIPDCDFGFPIPRRCHTIARYGRMVIMTGGVKHIAEPAETLVTDDAWIFDLENYSWRKYRHSLPKPVFFHDSVITEEGWLLSFGGVDGMTANSARNNILHGAWFNVPSLQRLSLETLRKKCPKMFSGLYCGNMRYSHVVDVFNVFCKKGFIKDQERKIIENGQITFHENMDGTRLFLNADAQSFAVTHRPDEEPIEQPRRRRRLPGPRGEPNFGLRHRIQQVANMIFGNMAADDDDEVDDEEEDDEEEEEEQVIDENEMNLVPMNFEADDDFENGWFERIPMRQPWRRGNQ